MDNNELENVETESSGLDAGQAGLIAGAVGVVFGIGMGIKAWWTKRQLKKEREKNALYQEAIRKHQAEINALKNDKEREEYKNRLYEELIRQSEE